MIWVEDEALRHRLQQVARSLLPGAHGLGGRAGASALRQAHELLIAIAEAPSPAWHVVEGATQEDEGVPVVRWVHSMHVDAAAATATLERLRARWQGLLASHDKAEGHALQGWERRSIQGAMQAIDPLIQIGPRGCAWTVRKLEHACSVVSKK